MRKVALPEVKDRFSRYLREADKEQIVIRGTADPPES